MVFDGVSRSSSSLKLWNISTDTEAHRGGTSPGWGCSGVQRVYSGSSAITWLGAGAKFHLWVPGPAASVALSPRAVKCEGEGEGHSN